MSGAGLSRRDLLGLGRPAKAARLRRDPKQAARQAWGAGDYRRLGARLEPAAVALVRACGLAAGRRVLDVGAGDGNAALAAAATGADVVAIDLSPALVERGRARSEAAGAGVRWDVGDAEALPYADGEFDCVLSSFGAIYAPDQRRVAGELERVLRPGGTLALTAWSSAGFMGRLLRLAAAAEGLGPARARPERWGRFEGAALALDRFEALELEERSLEWEFASEEALWEELAEPPGPLAAAAAAPRGHPPALRDSVAELAAAYGGGTAGGVSVDVGYGLLLARRSAHLPVPRTVARTLAPE